MRETRKATSRAAEEAEAGVHHGARSGVRERVASWRKKISGKSSGVGSKEEVRVAYRVAGDPSGVEGEEGVRKAYGVA